MTEGPRYTTLHDYLRVLRENRLLILLTVLAVAGGAYAISSTESKVYEAESSLAFHDPSQDIAILNQEAGPQQTDDQRASIKASLVTSSSVAKRAQRALHTKLSPAALRGHVSTQVEARTALVVVRARWPRPEGAARIANEFARQTVDVAAARERARLDRTIRDLRRSAPKAKGGGEQTAATILLYQQRISALQAARNVASPAEVVKSAVKPGSPISPKPLRNTILGALGGLVLGILAAFFRDALDRRLRPSADLEDELELPALAHVSEEALGTAFPQNGQTPVSASVLESFRMLRAGLLLVGDEPPPRTVLVTSALPAEGKTTVAAGLARVSAYGGRRTLLIDADLHRPALAQRVGVAPRPGLADVLSGDASFKDVVQEVPLAGGARPTADGGAVTPPVSLYCISAGSTAPSTYELMASQRFERLLEDARALYSYDLVVIDSGPLLSVADSRSLVPIVDAVLYCVRTHQTSREQATAGRVTLERFHARRVGLVVTGIREQDESYYGYGYGYPAAEPAGR